jgi:hypothetical protein
MCRAMITLSRPLLKACAILVALIAVIGSPFSAFTEDGTEY